MSLSHILQGRIPVENLSAAMTLVSLDGPIRVSDMWNWRSGTLLLRRGAPIVIRTAI